MGFLGMPLSIRGHFYLERKLRFCAEILRPKKHPPIMCSLFFRKSHLRNRERQSSNTHGYRNLGVPVKYPGSISQNKGHSRKFSKMVQEVTCCTPLLDSLSPYRAWQKKALHFFWMMLPGYFAGTPVFL